MLESVGISRQEFDAKMLSGRNMGLSSRVLLRIGSSETVDHSKKFSLRPRVQFAVAVGGNMKQLGGPRFDSCMSL